MQVSEGGLWKWHVDHLRERGDTSQEAELCSTTAQSVDLESVSLPSMETRTKTMGAGVDMSAAGQNSTNQDQLNLVDTFRF